MPTFTHIAVDTGAAFSNIAGDHKWKNPNGDFIAGPDTGSAVINCNGFYIGWDRDTAPGSTVEFYNIEPFTGGNSTAIISCTSNISVLGSVVFNLGCQLIVYGSGYATLSIGDGSNTGTIDFYETFTIEVGATLSIGTGNSIYIHPSVQPSILGSFFCGGSVYIWGRLDLYSAENVSGGGYIYLQSDAAIFNDVDNFQIMLSDATGPFERILPPTNLVKSGTLYNGGLSTGDASPSTLLPFSTTPTSIGPYSVSDENVGPYKVI